MFFSRRAAQPTEPDGSRRVFVVSPDETFCQRVVEIVDASAAFHAISVTELKFDALLAVNAIDESVLIDIDTDRDAALALIEKLGTGPYRGPIITFSETLDEPSLRGLLRFGARDWLPVDADSESILAALTAASAQPKVNQTRDRDLECWAFVPAAGGVGNTTLVIEAAFQMGRAGRPLNRICLIDLNFQSGALADHLEVEPGFVYEDVAAAPERLDSRLLEVMLSRHESGLAVLAAPRSPANYVTVEGELLIRVLDAVSQMFDVLLIDMPPMWTSYSDLVITGCDHAIVVTEPTVPALRKARELADALPSKLTDDARVQVIVNKWREEFLSVSLKKRDAEEVLNGVPTGFLPSDASLVRDAINRGQQISALSRSNKISRELARIVNEATEASSGRHA
ncbi:MAG: hypothetical protein AAGC70_20700 [Pseudomonadota bacterium]